MGALGMPIRTILAVTTPQSTNADLEMAVELCAPDGIHLSVLVMSFAAPPPIGEYAAMVSDAWMEERQQDAARLEARRAAVSAFLQKMEISGDVTVEYPEAAFADEAIGRRARYADVTIIGPEVIADKALKTKVVEGALFSSGRPLLIVPRGSKADLRPKSIVVGWDGRIECARAVREALEILKTADDVRLVLVDPAEGETAHGEEPGADAAAYLARHGVAVTVDRLPLAGHSVAEVLSRRAVDCGAGMLVMGGYGHSRIRERIFGGVTRAMVEDPKLPVLMAR
jgi:nucleotide-binding universal stress UspA family protein